MSAPTEFRCNVCGRPAASADRYCGFCGARLDGDNPTPTAETTGEHQPHVDRILASLRAATIGEYDVAGELGRGGMAVVFLAHDLSLNRKVAIKALLPELLYTEGMDRRFKHEARIAAKLDHPNILVIHSVREANELLYIVMKLVEGLPLSSILKVAGPLPVPVVRQVVRHVAEALAYAHGEGVVHRDVKPANIMVDRRGNVVVMDFGIAKAADDAHLTRTGLVIGTPAYMSPEQCLAQGVTSASDQYSLGIVAYELLTGKTPFRGSALEMQWAHATAAPPSVRSIRPDCPPDLEAVVLRMMAKAPADRWPTLHDVSHALPDEPSVIHGARSALVTLVGATPGRRDPNMPTTPASPVPIGPGPAAAGEATTDPLRATTAMGGGSTPAGATKPAPNAAPVAAPALTLSQQRIELTTGDSVELVVELESDEQATDGTSVLWQSSDPAIASVSTDGFVTAVAPGFAEIACVWRGRRAVCVVQVAAAVVKPAQPEVLALRGSPAARSAAAAPLAATAAATPNADDVAHRTGASWASRWASSRWLAGIVAAGLVSVAVYRGTRSDTPAVDTDADHAATVETPAAPATPASGSVSPPPAVAPSRSAATAPSPAAAGPKPPPSPNVKPPVSASSAAGTGQVPARSGSSTTGAPGVPATKADPRATASTGTPAPVVPQVLPPTLSAPRPDSSRLTARPDSTSGYGASRPSASPAVTPTTAVAPSSPPKTDSAANLLPVPTKDMASLLFREFGGAVNKRMYTRITSAYSQPTTAEDVKLWQDFLLFVRDYMPATTLRLIAVDSTTSPPTITATMDFRWSTDAGFETVRAAKFTGIAVPITDGWQLHRVRLAKRFW